MDWNWSQKISSAKKYAKSIPWRIGTADLCSKTRSITLLLMHSLSWRSGIFCSILRSQKMHQKVIRKSNKLRRSKEKDNARRTRHKTINNKKLSGREINNEMIVVQVHRINIKYESYNFTRPFDKDFAANLRWDGLSFYPFFKYLLSIWSSCFVLSL